MDYAEARRQARAILGQHADLELRAAAPFPCRVGVWSEGSQGRKQFIYVGMGLTFEEALNDAQARQVEEETDPDARFRR